MLSVRDMLLRHTGNRSAVRAPPATAIAPTTSPSARPRRLRASPATANARPTEGRYCRSEEHTSELQSLAYLVCRLLLEKKNNEDFLNAALARAVGDNKWHTHMADYTSTMPQVALAVHIDTSLDIVNDLMESLY